MNMTENPSETRWNKWITRLAHLVFRFTRPMTLGVRGIVLDSEEQVFLVRHSYVHGWHFPGGGVETGETLEQALAKELREEGNIMLEGEPQFHGVFLNRHVSPRDHVAVFVVRAFHQTAPKTSDAEIIEARFFPIKSLPATTTKGTRRRLSEVLDDAQKAQEW